LIGKAQWGAHKASEATETWKQGQLNCKDVYAYAELEACLSGTIKPKPVILPKAAPVAQVPPTAVPEAVIKPRGSPVPEAKSKTITPSVPSGTPLSDISGEQFDALASAAMGKIVHGIGDVKVDKMIGTKRFARS
jgi:hypothetical protein